MIKVVLKIFLFILLSAFLLVLSSQLILSYPAFLFPEKVVYRNFTVLSDKEIDVEMTQTLQDISCNLIKTGFYDERNQFKIILCNSSRLTNFFDLISFSPPGAGFYHLSGNIYLFPSRINQFRLENLKLEGEEEKLLKHTYQSFQFDKVLTHEILHKLHSDSLGVWEFKRKMPPPHWKAEGFAEYYTFQFEKDKTKDYDFRERITLYLKYRGTFPLFYYKSQLIYEYLTKHEQVDFEDIMEDDLTEQEAFDRMIKWYNSNK